MNGDSQHGSKGGEWGGRKRRDDTPSFIRDAQARAEMLNPARAGEHIPVLTMPSSVRLWRKVRWPLFVTILLVALVAVGLFTNDRLVARSIARKIADAQTAEAAATVEGLLENEQVLEALAHRHSGRTNAQVAYAWNSVLLSVLMGDGAARMERSASAFGLIGKDRSSVGLAALAGRKYVSGDADGALASADEALGAYRDEPRLHLVRALALRASGQKEQGDAVLDTMRKAAFDYLPALHVSLDAALEDGDRQRAKALSDELLVISAGDLRGSLASIQVRLPGWTEDEPDAAVIAALDSDTRMLATRIREAPRKLLVMGRYVEGRVAMSAGRLEEAVEALKFVDGNGGGPQAKAWYAMAVRRHRGAGAALAVLEKVSSGAGAELESLRAQCYLDHHRLDEAASAIAAMGSEALEGEAARLGWVLAVRSGDVDKAKESMPEEIGGRLMWPALELFELLRRAGDEQAIADLAGRMTGAAAACSRGIEAWMRGSDSNVNEVLGGEPSDACLAAMSAKLMRGHMPLELLEAAAAKARTASGGELSVEVDRALAVWMTQGREAATGILDGVRALRPKGDYIGCALAEAYLKMGLPAEAAEALDGLDSPRAVSMRIQATRDGKGKDEYAAAVAAALSDVAVKDHPAIVYWDLERRLEAGELDKVVAGADAIIERAGEWTAEIADLKAKAQNAIGSRADADRGLLAAAKLGRTKVGRDEDWQAKLALIRLNLRRGGAFLFKAVGVTLDMYKAGVRDAELSYSYAIANIRQGNERGAMKYLREAIELDPSFLPPFTQLSQMGKLEADHSKVLERTRPGTTP